MIRFLFTSEDSVFAVSAANIGRSRCPFSWKFSLDASPHLVDSDRERLSLESKRPFSMSQELPLCPTKPPSAEVVLAGTPPPPKRLRSVINMDQTGVHRRLCSPLSRLRTDFD